MGTILLFFVLALLGELIAASLTGMDRRTYAVLPPHSTINADTDLATYAARYLPEIRVNPAHVPPHVEQIWYQAVDHGPTITLAYYLDWSNEIHPNPIFHRLYELYRRAVYGSEHDIEYIEVQIDKTTGQVQRLRFETAAAGDYNRSWTTHLFAYIKRVGIGYGQCILEHEGHCAPDTIMIDGAWDTEHKPVLGVMTWNHLYEWLPADDYGAYTEVVQAPLVYLTDEAYSDFKLARRSQGDLKTATDETPRTILRVIFWSLSAILTLWLALGRTQQ